MKGSGERTLEPWFCPRDVYSFRPPSSSSKPVPVSDVRSRSHASPHASHKSRPVERRQNGYALGGSAVERAVGGRGTNGHGGRSGAKTSRCEAGGLSVCCCLAALWSYLVAVRRYSKLLYLLCFLDWIVFL